MKQEKSGAEIKANSCYPEVLSSGSGRRGKCINNSSNSVRRGGKTEKELG